MYGFGLEPFGEFPFGRVDWAKVVLWDELPEEVRQDDLDNGGWYYKFVTSLLPPLNELRQLISKSFDHTLDPRKARKDLLEYIAGNFGIVPDLAEPEAYQRMKLEIAGRWRLIKGTAESYEVLCAIHGFSITVNELWWNGSEYSTTGPFIYNEVIGTIP